MKIQSRNISKACILSLTLLFFGSCSKLEIAELERSNVYDLAYEGERDFNLTLESVEIVKEDGMQNGLIEEGETVWYSVYIKNEGPDPARVPEEIDLNANALFILNNSSSLSNFDYTLSGEQVNEEFLDPGEVYFVDKGELNDDGDAYSFSLKRSFSNVGDEPIMEVILIRSLTEEYSFNIPIDYN